MEVVVNCRSHLFESALKNVFSEYFMLKNAVKLMLNNELCYTWNKKVSRLSFNYINYISVFSKITPLALLLIPLYSVNKGGMMPTQNFHLPTILTTAIPNLISTPTILKFKQRVMLGTYFLIHRYLYIQIYVNCEENKQKKY